MRAHHLLSVCLLWSFAGCGELFEEEAMLGEVGCGGDAVPCPSSAPRYSDADWFEDVGRTGGAFRVTPQERRAARWSLDLGEDRDVRLAPAPDGLWATWVTPEGVTLQNVTLDGTLASSQVALLPEAEENLYLTDLVVDERRHPAVAYTGGDSAWTSGVVALTGGATGDLRRAFQSSQPAYALRYASGPEGTLRMFGALGEAEDALYELASDGTVRWKQTDLRVSRDRAQRVPALGWDSDQLVRVGDDGVALLSQGPSTLGALVPVLSAFDRDGTLRWSAELGRGRLSAPSIMQRIAVTHGGDLVYTSRTDGGDLSLWLLDSRTGHAKLSLFAARRDYHLLTPFAIASNAPDDLYFALLTGTAEDPRATVCRLRPESGAQNDATCLELNEPLGGGRILSMTSPAAGTVVLAHSFVGISTDGTVKSSVKLSRLDF